MIAKDMTWKPEVGLATSFWTINPRRQRSSALDREIDYVIPSSWKTRIDATIHNGRHYTRDVPELALLLPGLITAITSGFGSAKPTFTDRR